jgi:hypothetical protein
MEILSDFWGVKRSINQGERGIGQDVHFVSLSIFLSLGERGMGSFGHFQFPHAPSGYGRRP